MVDGGVAADVDAYFARIVFPFGMRQFAGGDGAVIHQVMFGGGFFHDLAGEAEGRGRGQHHAVAGKANSGSADDIVEDAGFGNQIVGAMAGPDVVVVGTAIEPEVPVRGGVAGVGVISDLVRAQDVAAIVNFAVAVQLVDGADHFLLDGANRGDIFFLVLGLLRARRVQVGRGAFFLRGILRASLLRVTILRVGLRVWRGLGG